MTEIFRINEADLPWFDYQPGIRVKGLSHGRAGVPSMQYVEYGPDHTDPVHSHDTDEVFVVMAGALWIEGLADGSSAGSVVFIPRDTQYAVRAGPEGVRYFRIVVS
jgi:quercetin dioxygenase-like cupin family protein